MPKAYCQDCFLATEYSSSPAKFCAHCGQSLIGAVNVKPVKKQAPIVIEEETDNDEIEASETEDNTPLPDIKDLGIKIQYNRPKGEKISSLAKGDGKTVTLTSDSSKAKPLSKKQILAEFQKEAGSLRPRKNK